jgi:hypothetical protein
MYYFKKNKPIFLAIDRGKLKKIQAKIDYGLKY